MEWLQSILYGLVSGLTEFLPISSQAHQTIVSKVLGHDSIAPLRQVLIRIGCLLALLVCCRREIGIIRRDRRIAKSGHRRVKRTDGRSAATLRLLHIATIPMVLGLLLQPQATKWVNSILVLAAILVVNGIILYIPQHVKSGNKDARSLSPADGVLIGLCGAISAVPGISRMGTVLFASTLRGTDKNYALNFTLLLSIPALIILLVFDFVNASAGVEAVNAAVLLKYALTMFAAYLGTSCGIAIMRSLSLKTGFSGFAYYCWGMALFMIILYLTT